MSDPNIVPCSPEMCAQYHDQINRICHDQGWPPGYQVIFANPETGQVCYCTCGGGSGRPADEAATE